MALPELTNEELNELALKVSARLNDSSISRVLSEDFVQEVKSAFPNGYQVHYFMPGMGSHGLDIWVTAQPNGSIELELHKANGALGWKGVLKGAE
jgi:hypothetical protein